MRIKETLVIFNGYLCLRSSDSSMDKPEFMVRYWPMFRCSQRDAEFAGYPIGATMHRCSPGCYTPDRGFNDTRLYQLEQGGQTKPMHVEVIQCQEPNTKGKRVRWYYGEWQKLLKTGWSPIPTPIP